MSYSYSLQSFKIRCKLISEKKTESWDGTRRLHWFCRLAVQKGRSLYFSNEQDNMDLVCFLFLWISLHTSVYVQVFHSVPSHPTNVKEHLQLLFLYLTCMSKSFLNSTPNMNKCPNSAQACDMIRYEENFLTFYQRLDNVWPMCVRIVLSLILPRPMA